MYYTHSGRFTLGGAMLALAVGIAGGAVLAYVYGVGLILIPEAQLAAFTTVAFGALVGVVTGFGLIWGHVRNKQIGIVISTLSGLAALYLSWAVWLHSILERSGGQKISWIKLTQHPGAIWYLMNWVNQYGTWGLDSKTPTTGLLLWIFWVTEAATVIGMGALVAVSILQWRPYCETCGLWCRRRAQLLLTPVQDLHQLKLQLENKDLRLLEALGPGQKTGDRLAIDLHSCERCSQFHTLSAAQTLVQRKKVGRPTVRINTVVKHLIVGSGEAQTLRLISEKLVQTPKVTNTKIRGAMAGRS